MFQGTCVCTSVVFIPHSGVGHKAYICSTPVTNTDVFSKEDPRLISMHENSSSPQPPNTWYFCLFFIYSFGWFCRSISGLSFYVCANATSFQLTKRCGRRRYEAMLGHTKPFLGIHVSM